MKKKITISVYIAALMTMSGVALGQLTIRAGTTFGFSGNPSIYMDAAGNITTNNADFGDADFHLNIISSLTINGDLAIAGLRMTNGNVTVNNTLEIGQSMQFGSGLVTPAGSGRVVYAGSSSEITGANTGSFVNGILYQIGGGGKFYPIGTGSLFAPVSFDNIGTTEAIGVRVIEGSPDLTVPSSDVFPVTNTHYWEVAADSPSLISEVNTRVSLSLVNAPIITEGAYAVLQAATPGGLATNLRYFSVDNSQVTSIGHVTQPILAVGNIKEITLKVRDLITPYKKDGQNDGLYIEQIDAFDFNTVTLLDRWGVVVQKWSQYTNENSYDFSQLGPGNYIVIVEYGNNQEGSVVNKVSQMVTVLKTN